MDLCGLSGGGGCAVVPWIHYSMDLGRTANHNKVLISSRSIRFVTRTRVTARSIRFVAHLHDIVLVPARFDSSACVM